VAKILAKAESDLSNFWHHAPHRLTLDLAEQKVGGTIAKKGPSDYRKWVLSTATEIVAKS
jgi:hypothetical protein